MARIARVFGIILIVLGGVYFVLTGSSHPTSLIPAIFGLLLLICGAFAATPDAKKRMLWMHIAVTIGLLGFLFPGVRGGMALSHAANLTIVQKTAAQEEMIMALVCLIFTALCVRSFIAARVGRNAETV